MRVTIIADASFCSIAKVGGYGYWIACERGKVPGGGPFKGKVVDSQLAEMMAVCKALHEGLKLGLIEKGDDVLVQTDCLGAIGIFNKASASSISTTRSYQIVIEVFRKLKQEHDLKITLRHVKGHTGRGEPRYAANRACDHRAKEAMRAERIKVMGVNYEL